MNGRIIDGRAVASDVEKGLMPRIDALTQGGRAPHLAVVIVGADPASQVYVGAKVRACERLGITSTRIDLDANITMEALESMVMDLNADPTIDGILVQSPLPEGHDELRITDAIDPRKDVDGFHPSNLGRLVQGRMDGLIPCTPAGILDLLATIDVDLTGADVAVLGRSRIVGMPMALLLAARGSDATVTVLHSKSGDIIERCRASDVVIAAIGKAEMVRPEWIKPGAVVIDVGITRVPLADGVGTRLAGDVHPDVIEVASHLTPVPGGVGPMTIARLMANTVLAAERRR